MSGVTPDNPDAISLSSFAIYINPFSYSFKYINFYYYNVIIHGGTNPLIPNVSHSSLVNPHILFVNGEFIIHKPPVHNNYTLD